MKPYVSCRDCGRWLFVRWVGTRRECDTPTCTSTKAANKGRMRVEKRSDAGAYSDAAPTPQPLLPNCEASPQ